MADTVLLVDDERDIVAFMRDALEDEGYEVLCAYSGEEALALLPRKPGLVVLDVMMPGMDGYELCERIRESAVCPILFVSARRTEEDRVRGLLAGGDDYLVKPFGLREFKTRIYAHLRREKRDRAAADRYLRFGSLSIDAQGRELTAGGVPVALTAREFDILLLLALHPSRVLGREDIYERIWGLEADGDSATVTEHIKKIRAKLNAADPSLNAIETVWGVGYKWRI
ncbi:response regulator transcription factor [Saccharibacillus sp. CPCC 101409]|uniref:response regulator transcription factor n=1 Tax=Saccharibacillus sp. CPCC 101409 TaxID=3058041 RepID=UPI00267290A2|nr:response regulator transcription factor [Saccharibacillus sp. CPCC 101409]MDO3410105.1 response regulator transcription factor [Saccharibacillus sp. CPCC 101409]